MAKGGAYSDHIEVLQYLLYIFNTVFFCAGATIFALGLFIRFNQDMDEYIQGLGMYFYWNGTTVIIVGAIIVMINSFLACCGAYFTSRKLIIVYKVFSVISFLLLLAGSAYILDNGMEGSKLYPYVQQTMKDLIQQYQWDVSARRIVDIIQEYVGCCGGYSASDYDEIHVPVPNTCRDQVTGNQYGDSCAEIFSQYIEVRTGWICGLSLSLCFCQFFAMMFAVCMWQALKEIKD